MKKEKFIVWKGNYTYQDFIDKLTSTEKEVMSHIFSHMSDDNLLYLYQEKSQRDKRSIIEIIAYDMNVDKRHIQNKIYSIIKKQDEDRYFIYATKSKIKGEYFISPELALKDEEHYETIYRSIIPKLEKER